MSTKQFVRTSLRWLPASWKAFLEFYLDKSLGREFGGPFNGQSIRLRIFNELLNAIPFRAIIETGTFRGTTTSLLAEASGLPVFSVESTARFFYYAKLRLRKHKQVDLTLGDSREFLRQLAASSRVPRENVFFYLDAHWEAELPLREEVRLIGKHWRGSVIMIDDFEVPGDEGYKYDDYGAGQRLCLDYLGSLTPLKFTAFFPAASSDKEDGLKRGCVVLVDDLWLDKMNGVSSLRLYQPSGSLQKTSSL